MVGSLSKIEAFNHLVSHIFLPLRLPQSQLDDDSGHQVDLLITRTILDAIHQYRAEGTANANQWDRMARTVECLASYVDVSLSKSSLARDMANMNPRDVLAFYIRAQNACVVVQKGPSSTTFSIFEVQVSAQDVMSNSGKLLLQYPGPVVEIPNSVASDFRFQQEVANFLAQSSNNVFEEAAPTTRKANSTVRETRDTADPNYFTQLLLGILGGMGTVSCPPRITKRIADEVLWNDTHNPWRRSPIWLIIRVVLQTSLDSVPTYKHFMVFYHTSLIARCLDRFGDEFSSEVLFMMRAKMARRLLKLQISAPSFVIEAARVAAEGAQDLLWQRWTAVQEEQARSPIWNPLTFDFDAATNITLPTSRASLETAFQGLDNQIQHSSFTPDEAPRLDNVQDLSEYAGGALSRSFATHKHITLFDFESYVYDHLAVWVQTNLNTEYACQIVYSCFQQYISSALSHYTIDVADQSIMILTVMRLWVAIDQLATSDCGLLLKFPPEIPANILDPLLLRSSHHLEEAHLIQLYIVTRQSGVQSTNSSIFSGKHDSDSFAVQYFQQSPSLQKLKSNIEASAERGRMLKIEELDAKNEESARLAKQAEELEHDYVQVKSRPQAYDPKGEDHHWEHARPCKRCELERESQSLRITPHEWPLPTVKQEAEAIVFELQRPSSFTIWRDATYQILWDLGTESKNKSPVPMKGTIEGYDGLKTWRGTPVHGVAARITLASSTKSFNRSHYSTVTIPAPQNSVCVNNGLTFRLYDQKSRILASDPFTAPSFARYGTLRLPKSGRYWHLDYAVKGVTHTSNQVLAHQHDCPKNLSLHEHVAFGTLRSGPRLQWLNILRGLEEGILTFNRTEVGLLHAQAAWQIGPLSEDLSLHEWHAELEEPNFRDRFIDQCFRLLDRVKGNWLEANSVSVIVLLVTRLLASTHRAGSENAYNLLRVARRVAFGWLSELQEKLHEAQKKENAVDFQYLICEVAMTCRSTFDVGFFHLPNVLRTQEDFIALINSAIIFHDNRPSGTHATQADFKVLLCREYRFAHRLTPYVLQFLEHDHHILSGPLSSVWPGYKPSPEGWKSIAGPNKCWVSATTPASEGNRSQIAHFNLLNGRLLIDGKPLSRLPRQYYEHSAYTRLFGERILHVVPANAKGMEFASRDHIHGHEVLFALDKVENRLIIQARKDGETFQLVDYSRLSTDLPEFFSTDYHHWAHLGAKTIEFRPLSHPWSYEHSHWRINLRDDGGASMDNLEDGSALVDIHSLVFQSISSQLAPLELPRYVHVTLTRRSSHPLIHVSLPRMKLQFFINQEFQLESYNFRGQIIDPNQSIGAFFGLRNQLVLCARQNAARLASRSRSVLVPHGDISVVSHDHHVLVTIQSGSGRSIPFHRYQVDTDLGYLSNDTGLTSRLFKIYLHALTSHCLPDTITQRTGTEEALYELGEPATSSFEQINEVQAELLGLIGFLTPKREYYPIHLTRMQKTYWKDIPALSQHYKFSTASAAILRRSETLRLFFPLDFKPSDHIRSTTENLLKRAAQRSAPFYPADTANWRDEFALESALGSSHGSSMVHERLLLNWGAESQSAARAFRILIRGENKSVHESYDLLSKVEGWGSLSGPCQDLNLTYSPQWLSIRLSETWISMYNLLRQAGASGNIYGASVCLAVGLFSQGISLRDLPVLASFAKNPAFRRIDPPPYATYYLQRDGYEPNISRVRNIISSNAHHISSTPAADLIRKVDESNYNFRLRKEAEYQKGVSEHQATMATHYLSQWPLAHPTGPTHSNICSRWFNVESCTREMVNYFTSCAQNVEIRAHLRKVQQALFSGPALSEEQVPTTLALQSGYEVQALAGRTSRVPTEEISLGRLMVTRSSPEHAEYALLSRVALVGRPGALTETSRLAGLFAEFRTDKSPLNRRYGQELDASREDLCSKRPIAPPGHIPPMKLFIRNEQFCEAHLEAAFLRVERSLGPMTAIEQILSISGVWPRLTPRTILAALSLKSRSQYTTSLAWQNIFIGYARAFVEFQRSKRLAGLAASGNTEELLKELDVESGSDSDPDMCDPDWLLVQIQGNFRARAVQRRVAHEMISPSASANTVLQLNMGEGKSSVIVPIIAATLADTRKLVRVIVLKPLWRQMFHLLVNRLSGLVHRRIYYLPFARNVQLDSSQAHKLQELYAECMREGGILLAQPEHILSFKLMGIDHLVSSSPVKRATSTQLRGMQQWLTANTRDILDESDEILHVRYQLVYTVGTQHPLENHPDRWTITQRLLRIVGRHILRLKDSHPEAIEYESRSGGQYPALRIMADCDPHVEHLLITSIAKDVLDGHLPSLNFGRLPRSARQLVSRFLTDKDVPHTEGYELSQECDEVMWQGLLLLRGMLALGVLVFALKSKRYRVDYGLDLTRSLLAVPFRAKDVPSLRAEFGHPDVAVLLTCLSYYYKGLTNNQLQHCFELVQKLDNPTLEYEQWVRHGDVPTDLLQLNGVNAKDREQFITKIIPVFSHNPATIDFFLSSVVFPKAAKEFPQKLATSGWDLAEPKAHVTTGFSGTNDNQYLLPTSITQRDPVQQLSTNALVLTYLLQPENNHYLCMRNKSGGTFTTKQFLYLLVAQQPEVRVLLDVGAQMLELQNEELVRCWLDLRPDIEAAVCFNGKDELIVVTQNGTTSAFYSSPYSQQLDKCVVYLDDGHTRGTDLKLPRNTRALVTLGPKVTKDRLLQGCMRMRKLGHGQSIIFAAPPEIDRQIRNSIPQPLSLESKVDTLDILRWSMLETCKDLQHHVSNWAQQGLEHNRRAQAEVQYGSSKDAQALKAGWVSPESRSLTEMYGVQDPSNPSSIENFASQVLAVPEFEKRLAVFGAVALNGSRIDEEQEREVSHEIEREQQVEYPRKKQAAEHELHHDVISFAQTGTIPDNATGVTSLFGPLCSAHSTMRNPWSKRIFASVDFSKTVTGVPSNSLSDYMRPVNWVLRGAGGIRLVLSPFEVNKLLPVIRQSEVVQLHVYAPRTTHLMKSFSDLKFYCIPHRQPTLPRTSALSRNQLQLDLFAGQLYLPSYQAYGILCAILGIYNTSHDQDDDLDIQTKSDGFLPMEYRQQIAEAHPDYAKCAFTISPVPVLKELIGRRRKGMEYTKTHLGQVLYSRSMTPNDF